VSVNIGLQIHHKQTGAENKGTRDYSAEEKADLDALLPALNPSAILVLEEYGWATRFRDMLPNAIVVYRKYHDREGDFYNVTTPEHLLNDYRQYAGRNIVINIGNESSSLQPDDVLKKQADFYAKCMLLFGKARIPIVVPNWGTGHPQISKLSLFTPIWEAFRLYPFHYLGTHEYFSYRGLEIGNGRVGRHADIAKWLTDNGYPTPNMLITEHGCDQIDSSGERGWKSGYDGDEDRYADDLIKARRQSYNVPYIKGVMIYSYGDSNEWPDFNIAHAKQLQKRLIAENKVVLPPPANIPPAVPLPTPLGLPNKLTITVEDFRIRDEATTKGVKVGTLRVGEQVVIYGSPVENADGYMWHVVERLDPVPTGEAKSGWTAYPLPAAPPIVDPPPVETFPNNPPTAPGLELVFPFPPGTTAEIAQAVAGMFAHAYVREVRKAS
jgi:hypothetical protein